MDVNKKRLCAALLALTFICYVFITSHSLLNSYEILGENLLTNRDNLLNSWNLLPNMNPAGEMLLLERGNGEELTAVCVGPKVYSLGGNSLSLPGGTLAAGLPPSTVQSLLGKPAKSGVSRLDPNQTIDMYLIRNLLGVPVIEVKVSTVKGKVKNFTILRWSLKYLPFATSIFR